MYKLTFLLIFLIVNCFSLEKAKIGFVFDGKEVNSDPLVAKIKMEIVSLLEDEYEVEIVEFRGDWTLEGAKKTLDGALNSDVDVVVSMGFLSGFEALELKNFKKPIVLAYDIELYQSGSEENIYSSKLAYYQGKRTFFSQVQQFIDLVGAKKIGVISDASLLEGEYLKRMVEKSIVQQGGEAFFIPVTDDVRGVFGQLKKNKIEAVILLPTYRLSQENFDLLASRLKVPSFSFLGESEVDKGILMSMTPESEKLRLSRRIALNVQEMLFSKDNKEIVIDFFRTSEVILNDTTMKKLEMDFTWSFLAEAKIINKAPISDEELLTIKEAVQISLQNNPNLNAERNVVKSGEQLVNLTQAPLLPQVNTGFVNQVVDRNTALYARGLSPESAIYASIGVSQLIYDESLVSNFEIQKYLQSSREYDQQRVELNTILFAAVFYVEVLKIEQEKQIALENIALSKANLHRGYELVESGQKSKSEIYRWESEVANNKDQLAEVEAKLENRKADFNRQLNRPITEKVYLEGVSFYDPDVYRRTLKVMKHTQTPLGYENFKRLLVDLAQKKVPEIKVLEQQVLAQKRQLKATKREFVLPSVYAFAETQKILAKDGFGSEPPPGVSNSEWSTAIGVTLSYPILTGGARIANMNKAYFDLKTVEYRKDEVIQSVSTRVVKAIDLLKSSYDQIFYSKTAKEAAEKNLTIVTNAYSRGIVSIVDLLDAQNITIVSSLSYSNAIHDFLINYLVLQRAVGDFDEVFIQEESNFSHVIKKIAGEDDEE